MVSNMIKKECDYIIKQTEALRSSRNEVRSILSFVTQMGVLGGFSGKRTMALVKWLEKLPKRSNQRRFKGSSFTFLKPRLLVQVSNTVHQMGNFTSLPGVSQGRRPFYNTRRCVRKCSFCGEFRHKFIDNFSRSVGTELSGSHHPRLLVYLCGSLPARVVALCTFLSLSSELFSRLRLFTVACYHFILSFQKCNFIPLK